MPTRKVNLAAVRAALDEAGGDLTYEQLAERLGVTVRTVENWLPVAIWECAGVRLVRDYKKVVGVRRQHPAPEYGEVPAE